MNEIIHLLVVSFVCVCGIMSVTWLIGKGIGNYSIVDVAWAFNFLVIAALIWFMAGGYMPRKAMACALLALWSIRLGLYLASRVFAHIHQEEGRYVQLRKGWALHIDSTMFGFYQLQALSNVLLVVPHVLTASNATPGLVFTEYAGAVLWFAGIAGEGIADYQLKRFKANAAHKNKVCESGLWRYSRHPNYFFQLLMWVGIILFSIATPWGWLSIFCGGSIAWLLFRVTGIPLTEEQALRSKGEAYKRYRQTTSMIVPWRKLGQR